MVWFVRAFSLVLTLALFTSLVAADEDLRFPVIEGKALTGDRFVVPDSLVKPNNVLLVAFLREQQEDIDTWMPRLEKTEDAGQGFAVYEFPILGEMNPVTRWFIYQGMRGGITSKRARARTVTFHLDKEEFRKALGIATEDSIQVFLADSTGKVLWRDSGVWSEAKEREMLKAVLPRTEEAGEAGESDSP